MRGKVYHLNSMHTVPRITPAYAGKRMNVTESAILRQDHPRLCGEKIVISNDGCFAMGSPPPMRGKVFRLLHPSEMRRITPAYAGKRK